ncbi:MAG TPA: signal peptidase II [Candidatus Acidoferrum sp.]|jgi:signal peptidase II|nr:signal peptidase II [Candidatus Acidoferrum sp.]
MPGDSSRSAWHGLAFLSLIVLVADQASKFAVQKFTLMGSQRVVIPGLINLVHTSNPGVAFGLLADSDKPWVAPLLIVFSTAVIALLLWLLATGRAGGRLGQAGLALILGGAAGNVLDRVLRHSVTDFIDFHIGSYHWYTFNVADSAIVIGAGLVVLELFRDWRHPSHERAS